MRTHPATSGYDKDRHTLLIPDLFPIHMELLAAGLRASGYRVEVLKYSGRQVLDIGLRYLHNDMCYPAICSVGQQLCAVTSGDYDLSQIALIQFQTGGGCRASNYGKLLEKALEKLSLSQVPVVTLGFSGAQRKDSGFQVTPAMIFRLLAALTYGDILMQLRNQVQPYEAVPGETQHVMEQWMVRLKEDLRQKNHSLRRLRRTLRQIAEEFHAIPRRAVKRMKVGIVGEVYVKYSPFANNHLQERLEAAGCECMLPGVLGFLHYCLAGPTTDWSLYGGSYWKKELSQLIQRAFQCYENALASVLKDYPEFIIPAAFGQMEIYGERVLSRGVKMGEGWYLPAEMIELLELGYDTIVCLQPFGCLPNHIVGRGVIRRIQACYPKANIYPVDYDANASEVNQENRIRLLLSLARERSKEETALPAGSGESV